MQVNCPQCQTLYEIDIAQLGNSGQHFKCVNCEFVFFVAPPVPPATVPGDYYTQPNPYDQATINFQQPDIGQAAGPELGFNPSNLPSATDHGYNPTGFPSPESQSPSSGFSGFQPPPPNIDFSAGRSNHSGYETELLNDTSGPSLGNEPTTFPMKDHEPPQLDFTPPMTSHAPTELPTGWIPDSSSGTGLPETSQLPGGDHSFKPPSSNLQFPSDTVPPPPSQTGEEFNPFGGTGGKLYGDDYMQQQRSRVYSNDFRSDGEYDQSLRLVEDSQKIDDINQTTFWNVKIGSKMDRGLQLIQLKNWIRGGTLRESDEVQEPGGGWIPAIESEELKRFFLLKSKIDADKYAQSLQTQKKGASATIFCQNHQSDRADWECVGCGRTWCDDCVKKQVFGSAKVNMCPKCGDRCIEIEHREDIVPFWQQIPETLEYPLKKHGPIMIGFAAFLWFLAALINIMTFGFGFFVAIMIMGLVISYQLKIIYKSSRQKDSGIMPDFPDVTNNFYAEMLLPFFQMLIAFILYFFVPIVLSIYFISQYSMFFITIVNGKPQINSVLAFIVFVTFILLGYFLFPMVTAIIAVHKTVVPAFNPILIMRLIKRALGPYTLLVIILTVMIVAYNFALKYFSLLLYKLSFPILVVYTIQGFCIFYLYAVLARMIGLFVKQVEEDLAWRS